MCTRYLHGTHLPKLPARRLVAFCTLMAYHQHVVDVCKACHVLGTPANVEPWPRCATSGTAERNLGVPSATLSMTRQELRALMGASVHALVPLDACFGHLSNPLAVNREKGGKSMMPRCSAVEIICMDADEQA
jgi:hypothetical protein